MHRFGGDCIFDCQQPGPGRINLVERDGDYECQHECQEIFQRAGGWERGWGCFVGQHPLGLPGNAPGKRFLGRVATPTFQE